MKINGVPVILYGNYVPAEDLLLAMGTSMFGRFQELYGMKDEYHIKDVKQFVGPRDITETYKRST